MDKGGQVICGGIHMSTIASFSYNLLWEERMIRSVANLTRANGHDFFEMLKEIPVQTETIPFTECQPGPWRNV
jgi:propanol-preferring alcohol dehydrogenase